MSPRTLLVQVFFSPLLVLLPSFQIVVSPTFESVEVQKGVISKLDAKKNEGKLLDEITRNKSQG